MCSYKSEEISINEITWRKVRNTVSKRMIDDSLIHLFTSNKRIKRRTKLLNSYLREIPPRQIITYNDYIKAKTAVLRTLSDDEETNDDEEICPLNNRKTSLDSQKNTLRILLKEMMLDSADSGDEFEKKSKKLKGQILKNSSLLINNGPSIPKRSRGRPRKISTLSEAQSKSKKATSQNTRTLKKLLRNRERKISSNDELIPENSQNIVEVIINNNNNSNNEKLNSPISEVNSIDSMDPLADPLVDDCSEFINANNQMKNSSEIIDNKIDVIEDDDEFLTPHTSDCADSNDEIDDAKSNLSIELNEKIVDDNSMINDDMFEEEKVVTDNLFNVPDKIEELNKEIDDKKSSNSSNKSNTEKDSSSIDENLLIEDEENSVENILKKEDESLTQLLDINCKESVENINIYADDVSVPEESSSFHQNNESDEKMSQLTRKKFSTPPKISENDELIKETDDSNISNIEIIVSKKNKKINSPKTAADVRRNLMISLDNVAEESAKETNETHQIVLNSSNSEKNHSVSTAPIDSGIDDDSGDVLIQEYLRLQKEEESEREEDTNQLTSPMKKKLNLKITCTEVVTSKYMIIRDNKHIKPLESKDLSDVHEKLPVNEIKENDINSNNLEESEGISEEGNNISLHWETEDEEHHNISFKNQLADDSCEEDDHRSNENSTIDDFYNSEVNERDEIHDKLPAPTESESLKWILDSISSRKRIYDSVHQRVLDPEDEEAAFDRAESLENEDFSYERLPRPTCIPEFIEGTNLMPLNNSPSFTLADIDEDDDIYLIEIPKAIVEQNLKDQRFKLKKRKIIIGNDRYDIQKKECEPLSCILHSGDRKNRYKTGTIEPLHHIIVRQQVRDDVVKAPKFETETRKSVPFPMNIKPRNPLIAPEEEEELMKSSFSRGVRNSDEIHENSVPEGNQENGNSEENENYGKRKKLKKRKKGEIGEVGKPELLEESKDCGEEKRLKDYKESYDKLKESIENRKIDIDDESVSSASAKETFQIQKKRKTEEYYELQENGKTKIEEQLETKFDNSDLNVPEDAVLVDACINDDWRLSTNEEKMKDSKESLDMLETVTNLTNESSASNEDGELESAVLLEIIKKKISRRRKLSSEADEEVATNDELKVPRKRKKLKRKKLNDENNSDCLQNHSDASSNGAESNFKVKRRRKNDSVSSVDNSIIEAIENNESAFVKKSFYVQIMD